MQPISEPAVKRAVSFFDGQNIYRHAKDAFGHHYPNFDPIKLADAVCAREGWAQHGVRFYTGVPDANKDPMWHGYWSNRLLHMRRAGILVTHRPLRYREIEVIDQNGNSCTKELPQEKGIDVRLSLDVIRLCLNRQLDVAVIFSQDQDLSEIVEDAREIAKSQTRWIRIASAFPSGPSATSARGIERTHWVKMEQPFYDACLDQKDYRPLHLRPSGK